MPEYIGVPIDSDPEDFFERVVTYIQSKFPGWTPSEGNLDVVMARAIAQNAAELGEVASAVPTNIFRYFGATLAGLPPVDAAPASVASTWVAVNDDGYTVEQGTLVGVRATGDTLIPFEVLATVVIPPGSTSTAAGAVQLVAVDPGDEGSGLGGVGVLAELIDPLEWVATITLTGITTGGVDAELDDVYLNRLVGMLQLLSPRLILPRDFALATRNIAGVERAVAIDGFIPPASTNQERAVAVAAVDAAGNPVAAPVKSAIDTYLQANREINFIVNVIDPTQTTVDVTFTVKAYAGFDLDDVADRAEQAVRDYLDPSSWGVPGTGDNRDWINTTVVRYLEIAQAINNTEGVDYITGLTIGLNGGAQTAADQNLTGTVPLPIIGAIVGAAS